MLGAKLDNCQLLETQDWEVGALVDAERGVLVGIDWRLGAVSGSWFASDSLNGPNGNNRAATILPQCFAPPKAALIIVIMYCCPCSLYYPHLGASALVIPALGHGFVQLVLLCFLKKTFSLPLPRCNSLAIVIHARIYQLGSTLSQSASDSTAASNMALMQRARASPTCQPTGDTGGQCSGDMLDTGMDTLN